MINKLRDNSEKIILVSILVLAFLIRLSSLSRIPMGFNADEASFGYDAYSILHTGRDQWGTFLPIVLKSFGDYKSPLYSYLIVPSVAAFGLNVFATRFPNVIVGTLAVIVAYLLVKELTRRYTEKLASNHLNLIALTAALLMAVSPWPVMMSRGAFEGNLVTLLIPAGVYFFLKGLEKPKYLLFSAFSFGLSFFSYHSAKVISPIVIFSLTAILFKELLKIKRRKLIAPILILVIFIVGLACTFLIGGGSRIAERSITNGAVEVGAEEKIKLILGGTNPTLAKILHNKYQVIAQRFIANYSQYFSGRFLFTDGAGDATYGMRPGIGVSYILEGILLLGAIPLFLRRETKVLMIALTAWLLLAPVPAALATGVGYSGNRAMGMVPVIQILESFGVLGWWIILKKVNKNIVYFVISIFLVVLIVHVSHFLKIYSSVPDDKTLNQMLYGSLETGIWLSENEVSKNVMVTRSLSEPQIFIAFASKWDPADYQNNTLSWNLEENNTMWVDQLPGWNLGNYSFGSIDPKKDLISKNRIIVGRADELPKNLLPSKTIYYPDGIPEVLIINNY